MDQPQFPLVILTPFNFFEWKPKVLLLLRSKGLYRITMGNEPEPNFVVNKLKCFNKMDEAFGLLCLSISLELLFHVKNASTPNEVWTTLEGLLRKQDILCGHQLENELISMSPDNFETLQDFFTKFKSLLLQLKACGIKKEEEQLTLSILSKWGPEYSIFVSSFHTSRLTMGTNWKIPLMDAFIESLIQEQDKLFKMGALKNPKSRALVVHESSKTNAKNKQKQKGKKESD